MITIKDNTQSEEKIEIAQVMYGDVFHTCDGKTGIRVLDGFLLVAPDGRLRAVTTPQMYAWYSSVKKVPFKSTLLIERISELSRPFETSFRHSQRLAEVEAGHSTG